MPRRNERLFRRLEQLMASGVPYTDAWIEANREYMGSLAPKGVYREWCRKPDACAGKGYCPLDPTCGD